MTRRTQKSYTRSKRQYTRRRAGGKRGQWIWTTYCIIRNGIEQCFRKRTWKANQKEETEKERQNREALEDYYRYSQ